MAETDFFKYHTVCISTTGESMDTELYCKDWQTVHDNAKKQKQKQTNAVSSSRSHKTVVRFYLFPELSPTRPVEELSGVLPILGQAPTQLSWSQECH